MFPFFDDGRSINRRSLPPSSHPRALPPSSPAPPPSMAIRWYEGMDAAGDDLGPWAFGVAKCQRLRTPMPAGWCLCRHYLQYQAFGLHSKEPHTEFDPRSRCCQDGSANRSHACAGYFCGRSWPRVRHYENVDAPGHDRGSWIRGVSSADCESICIADNGCAGYTCNQSRTTCIPKSIVARVVNSSEPAITGIVEGR